MSEFKVGEPLMIGGEYQVKESPKHMSPFSGWTDCILLALNRGASGDAQYIIKDFRGDAAILYEADNVEFRNKIKSDLGGHPHADLMAQYAEDAKANSKPWELWEVTNEDDHTCWNGLRGNPVWHSKLSYRRKTKTKLIHGVEVPDISFVPKVGDFFYCSNVGLPSYYEEGRRLKDDCTFTDRMVSRGLCYPHTEEGKQAAIAHAKAMLGIK